MRDAQQTNGIGARLRSNDGKPQTAAAAHCHVAPQLQGGAPTGEVPEEAKGGLCGSDGNDGTWY
eukprot:911936-Pyramimonas_sp.AAC.1